MRILFTKSKWEAKHLSLPAYLDRVAADGFDGTELHLEEEPGEVSAIRAAHADRGLCCVAQIVCTSGTPAAQAESFSRQWERALGLRPLRINCHLGSDVFAFDENVALHARALEAARDAGVPLCFETHRGRPTFSGEGTRRLLEALPGLRLTADFSHWMCVHESTLENQPGNVLAAQRRSDHIHARIGFPQGPQIADPLAPGRAALRARYLELWRPILDLHRAAGREWFTVTPEAGPPDYMPVAPFTDRPLADAWAVNVAVKNWLRDVLMES